MTYTISVPRALHKQALPCPFCGHVGVTFEDGSTYRWGVVSCEFCGATCGEVRREYPDIGAWHQNGLLAWNTRAAPAQPQQEPYWLIKANGSYVKNPRHPLNREQQEKNT